MKSIIVRCLVSLVFSLCLMGFGSQSILAATLPPSINSGSQVQTQEINLALNDFLDSIPSDYYAIRTPEALKKQLSKDKIVLIDVREINEYQVGHIPEAINIPLRTLTKHLDQIPSDSRIIVY
jgi:3-mercaptopyruvate sulfurtransferase SseA